MDSGDVFLRISAALNASSIPFMLVGSFASSYYGALRSTQDVDIVISATPEQLKQLVQELQRMDYYADIHAALDALRQRSMFNVIDNKTGWKIDFIMLKPTPFGREAFQRRRGIQFQGTDLFIASPEDLVISKLDWAKMGGSQLQVRDVATVLKKRWASLDHAYLGRWILELGLEPQWQSALQLAGI